MNTAAIIAVSAIGPVAVASGWAGWHLKRIVHGLKVEDQRTELEAGMKADIELVWIKSQIRVLIKDITDAGSYDLVLTDDAMTLSDRLNSLLERLTWEESTPGYLTLLTQETTSPRSRSALQPRFPR